MVTQIEMARRGSISEEMKACADKEGISPDEIRRKLEAGTVVVIRNRYHTAISPIAIGEGLRTKVNANVGTSGDHVDLDLELDKVRVSVEAGADTIMDLSTGGDIAAIRREIMKCSDVPVGTVPIYQAAARMFERQLSVVDMTADDMFSVIEEHGSEGVDFITVHCGVTRGSVERIRREGRVLGIVSRGGSILAHWMDCNEKENPLYEQYDRLLEIAKAYDIVLSLGDGLRPGCIADATDRGQIQELILLGELAGRAREQGVQVMIEGPGHVPIQEIQANIALEKRLCHGAPFYVLGPLPTDIAPGYDHIVSAIGGAIAGWAGADFLCYVTPSEHLRLPTLADVREGVMACKIAAHIADLSKGLPWAAEQDRLMAQYRKEFDWEGQIGVSVDPVKSRAYLETSSKAKQEGCTMCGEFCAIKMGRKKKS